MAHNENNVYDIDSHIAELYDQSETETADVALIRRLIGANRPLRILEPFTGTGRILLPLAVDGHSVVGMDQSHGMVERARQKAAGLPGDIQARIVILEQDVTSGEWPTGFDLVIMGGNCLYELATPEEQAAVIKKAAHALKPGGYAYVDNDHMEGELAASWQDLTPARRGIAGVCADGSRVESWMQTVWFDTSKRLARFKRWAETTLPDGEKVVREYYQQKHPVSAGEVQGWLESSGLIIEQQYGDRDASPYSPTTNRAIFWARKGESSRS